MTFNAIKFIYLQETINEQIDSHGKANIELCDQLEEVSRKLTIEEQRTICDYYI